MSKLYESLSSSDKALVDGHRAEIAKLAPRMDKLRQYTRPLGKAQVSFEQAIAYENEYNDLQEKANKHEAAIRRTYKKYFSHL